MSKYVYAATGQEIAQGPGQFEYRNGALYRYTGVKSIDLATGEITNRLREVAFVPDPAPLGGDFTATVGVPSP